MSLSASARLWGLSLWRYWVVPIAAPPPAVETHGFDVLQDESHLALRCQRCASEKAWRQLFGNGRKTLPAGMFLWARDEDSERIARTLRIHRLRCAAADAKSVQVVAA